MDCPRCRLSLSPAEYEGEQVSFCDNCWGYWMQRSQLDQIVADRSSKFSRGERSTVAREVRDKGDKDRTGTEAQPAPCPECGATMKHTSYTEACPIVIDECREHGVWLDAGELKELQVLFE